MRILITGCLGTLGRPLTKELRARGHDVWGCDLFHVPDDKYVRADVAEMRQLERVFEQPFDLVYHLAAEFGRLNGEEYYETLWRTNVIGTRNVLELQRRLGFRLVYASSSEVYGETGASVLYEELTDERGIMQPNDYAISKWVNEVQCVNFGKRYGSAIMRLRFFNSYGRGEYYHPYRSVVCLFCWRALHGQPYQVFRNYHRVFMYIDDFIPTLANACERFYPGEVINIGGAEYRSVEELSEIVQRTLGLDGSLVEYLPEDKHNVTNKHPDISKARRLLGHDPTIRLEEGVPKTLRWMETTWK